MYLTKGINVKIANDRDFGKFVLNSMGRFNKLDWGELCKEDKALNDWALKHQQGRIVARYNHINEVDNIYIIGSYSNSGIQVEILFCSEY